VIPDFLSRLAPEYWAPYIYQYTAGAVIFLAGLYLIIRHRACVLSRRQDRLWFAVLLAGFLWYAGIHLAWYLAAVFVLPTAKAGGVGG
jgi:hypothetical protein